MYHASRPLTVCQHVDEKVIFLRLIIFYRSAFQTPWARQGVFVDTIPFKIVLYNPMLKHNFIYQPRNNGFVEIINHFLSPSFLYCLPGYSFIHLFIHLFIHRFIPFIHSFLIIHSFLHSSTFIHLFILLFIHSFIHSFVPGQPGIIQPA
jgi:hypothetical protein